MELAFVWVPREPEMLRAAGEPSKWQDMSDWRFSSTFARQFGAIGVPDVNAWPSMRAGTHVPSVLYY